MSNESGANPQQSEGVAGVGMMIAAYVDELAADDVLSQMKQAKKAGNFYYDDAAIVRQDAHGKVHIKETGDMGTGKGAGVGALIGGVIGILGGPVGVAWGAAGGAAIGGLAAHHDAGFSKDTLKELGSALVPGSSAIVATTSQAFVEEVRRQVPESERMSTAHQLAAGIRENLLARQDTLLTLVITEEGIAATQVVSSPSAVAIFGIAADQSGVVVGQAVATQEGVAYEIAADDGEETAYEAGIVTGDGAVVVDAIVSDVEESDDADEKESEEGSEKK